MNRLYIIALSFILLNMAIEETHAQKRETYEWDRELPTYLDSLQKDLTYPMAWGNSRQKNYRKWQKETRAKVFETMMAPPPRAKKWDMTVVAEEQREGYKAQKIEFNASRYYRISALLLIPDSEGKHPAINLLHDHGAHFFIGKEKMIRPLEGDTAVSNDAERWARQIYDGQFLGDLLAKNGYVVISTDAPFWGERGRKEGVDKSKYADAAGNMMMLGRDLSAFMTYDDIATTDFLATLPCVDAERIGCGGCSMGAYRAWMLSALSDRIKAGFASCWMTTTDIQTSFTYGRKERGGFPNTIPALRQFLDYPHIASLACPKPMLFIAGDTDKLFPIIGVNKAYEQMRKVWKDNHADDKLTTLILKHPHGCPIEDQEHMLGFFNKWLK